MPRCFYLILILFLSCSDQKNENNEDKDVYFSKVFGEYDAEMGYSIQPTSDGAISYLEQHLPFGQQIHCRDVLHFQRMVLRMPLLQRLIDTEIQSG